MLITPKEKKPLRVLESLTKLGSYVVGAAVICYVSGFIIANLYLGSLGVVNVDMLRTRYILVGLLFLLFLGTIGLLLYGLLETLRSRRHDSLWRALRSAVGASLKRLAMLYLPIVLASSLAGSVTSPPVGVPGVGTTAPLSDWLSTGPRTALLRSALYTVVILSVVLALLTIVLIANPRDQYGRRKPRRVVLSGAWDDIV